jgi:hypothetical protein
MRITMVLVLCQVTVSGRTTCYMERKKHYFTVYNMVCERTNYSITSKNYRITIFPSLIYYGSANVNYLKCSLYSPQHPLSVPDVLSTGSAVRRERKNDQ